MFGMAAVRWRTSDHDNISAQPANGLNIYISAASSLTFYLLDMMVFLFSYPYLIQGSVLLPILVTGELVSLVFLSSCS